MADIYIHKGNDRKENIIDILEQSKEHFIGKLKNSKKIFIKVNFVNHEKQLAVTHVEAARGIVEFIRKYSDLPIIIGDAAYKDTMKCFNTFGFNTLVDHNNVELMDLNHYDKTEFGLLTLNKDLRNIKISKKLIENDFKISLAVMKTHCDTAVTLSMKNWAVGMMTPDKNEKGVHSRHDYIHVDNAETLNKNLIRMIKQFPFDLAIVDGFEAMQGNGPIDGTKVDMKVAVCGTDPVAVDTVCTKMMSIDPFQVGHLAFGSAIGENDFDKISTVSNVPFKDLKRRFDVLDKFKHTLE